MLSDLEVGQFWTFGFTVLRGCLSEEEVDRLQEAHSRVIAESTGLQLFRRKWDTDAQSFCPSGRCFRRFNRAARRDGSHA